MLIVFSEKYSNGVMVGATLNVETTDYYEKNLILYNEEVNEITELTERKQREWLSSRYLLQSLMEKNYRLAVIKQTNGKPFLIGSDLHISISHSANFTAAIVAPFSVGIDIQYITDKIDRIKHKFLSEKEYNHYLETNDRRVLHVYWGAKEALFKVYGLGSVDFRKHLYVEPFDIEKNETIGHILKDNHCVSFRMKYLIDDAFVLVFTCDRVVVD